MSVPDPSAFGHVGAGVVVPSTLWVTFTARPPPNAAAIWFGHSGPPLELGIAVDLQNAAESFERKAGRSALRSRAVTPR